MGRKRKRLSVGWEFRGAPTCAPAQPGLYSQAKHVQLIRLDSEQKLAQANCSMENDSVSLKVVTAAVCVAVVLLEVEAAALTPGPLELPIAAAKVRLGAQAAASTAANTAQATTARRHAAIATGESVGRRSSSDREADFPLSPAALWVLCARAALWHATREGPNSGILPARHATHHGSSARGMRHLFPSAVLSPPSLGGTRVMC